MTIEQAQEARSGSGLYTDNRSVLLVGDTEEARDRACRAAAMAGLRIVDVVELAAAAERVSRQAAVDAVMLELVEMPGPELEGFLAALEEAASAGRYGSVIAAPAEATDRIAGSISHARIWHLCEPTEPQRVAALAEAAARTPLRLQDVTKDGNVIGLLQLSEDAARISAALAALAERESEAYETGETGTGEGERGPVSAAEIRAIIRSRRLRERFFPGELFADPAWDMLLDLMAARLEEKRVAVSSLCIAASVPPTTALRWIKALTDRGLFVRAADPQDGRRVYIQLSDRAAGGMDNFLRAARRISPSTI